MLLFITDETVWRICFCGVSIHLMLLFILMRSGSSSGAAIVSIHLMLLFIRTFSLWCYPSVRFNTSHVTLYRRKHLSNTLQEDLFQYISCYSLSGIIPIIPCTNPGFNTSHVTLYLWRILENPYDLWVSIHLMLLFINI